jgi:cation transport ATPase
LWSLVLGARFLHQCLASPAPGHTGHGPAGGAGDRTRLAASAYRDSSAAAGEVYFDSVVMFTFLLLLARFVEKRVR